MIDIKPIIIEALQKGESVKEKLMPLYLRGEITDIDIKNAYSELLSRNIVRPDGHNYVLGELGRGDCTLQTIPETQLNMPIHGDNAKQFIGLHYTDESIKHDLRGANITLGEGAQLNLGSSLKADKIEMKTNIEKTIQKSEVEIIWAAVKSILSKVAKCFGIGFIITAVELALRGKL